MQNSLKPMTELFTFKIWLSLNGIDNTHLRLKFVDENQ